MYLYNPLQNCKNAKQMLLKHLSIFIILDNHEILVQEQTQGVMFSGRSHDWSKWNETKNLSR